MNCTTLTTALPVSVAPAPLFSLAVRTLLGQLGRFAVASGLGTAINIGVYLTARMWWDALPANLVALTLSTVLSTELNRWFTFGHTGTRGWYYYLQTVATVLFYAFYSSAVLLALHAVVTDTGAVEESSAITAASLLGGTARFMILRNWVFRPPAPAAGSTCQHPPATSPYACFTT